MRTTDTSAIHPDDGRTPPAEPRQLLTPEEAAHVLHIGRTTLFALLKTGALRPVHIGRSCRITRAELSRYIAHLDQDATTTPPDAA